MAYLPEGSEGIEYQRRAKGTTGVCLTLRAVAAAELEPVVDSIRPLDATRAATERMDNARQFGKIVLRLAE